MRIKLLTTRADKRRRYEIGDELDVPDGEAIKLIESKQAEPVRAVKTETAVRHRGEQTIQHRPKAHKENPL